MFLLFKVCAMTVLWKYGKVQGNAIYVEKYFIIIYILENIKCTIG